MDGARFDALARAWAGRASRRRLITGIVGVAGSLGQARRGEAARCQLVGLPCATAANCCDGACEDGQCVCPPWAEICLSRGVQPLCLPPCPAGQERNARCQCVCAGTGRMPRAGQCPCGCADGTVCTADGCRDLSGGCTQSSVCGQELVWCPSTFCVCDTTADGPLTCSNIGGFDCSQTCRTSAECGPGYACVTTACCRGAVCVPRCGSGGFLPAEVSPRQAGA